MKLLNLDSSKTYSIPDLYLNIGHLLDHFMMLIFAKAAFDAGREFGLSYEEIIIYGSLCLGVIFLLKNILLSGLIYFEGKLIKSIRIYLGEKLFKKYLFKNYKFHLKTNPSILLRNVSAEVSQTSSVILSYLKLIRELLVLVAIFTLLLMSSFFITISIFFFFDFNCYNIFYFYKENS